MIFLLDIVTIPQGSVQAAYRDTNLNDLLKNYGIRLTKDLVLDKYHISLSFKTNYGFIRTPYPFFTKIIQSGFNPDNSIVNRLPSMVFPWAGPIETLNDQHKDFQFTVLAQSSEHSWLQKGVYNLNPMQEFNPKPEEIKPEETLDSSLGIDSTEMVEISVGIKKELGVELGDGELKKTMTFNEIVEVLKGKGSA